MNELNEQWYLEAIEGMQVWDGQAAPIPKRVMQFEESNMSVTTTVGGNNQD